MLQHLLDEYRYAPEHGIWFFKRRYYNIDINIAVTMENGEVEQVEAWKTEKVEQFRQENEVVVRDCAPKEARKAAINARLEDLV